MALRRFSCKADGAAAAASPITYAAGFRHSRERDNYGRLMNALDFIQPETGTSFGFAPSGGAPAFFSGNLASLSRVLARVSEVSVTEQDRGDSVVQRIVYEMTP